jgi:hypothetical protein
MGLFLLQGEGESIHRHDTVAISTKLFTMLLE